MIYLFNFFLPWQCLKIKLSEKYNNEKDED